MRPSNKSRSRNKPGNSGNHGNNNNQPRRNGMGNIINRVFESAGPDGKVRGTPQQIIDKYQALARDAQVAGDRVTAESYLQHSEHYSRLLGEAQRQQMENNRFNQERDENRPNQEREDGNRFQERDDGNRFQNGEENRFQERDDAPHEDSYGGNQRRQPAMAAPAGGGLTTIDPEDSDDLSGPIETPEGRRVLRDDPAPVPPRVEQAQPAATERMNGGSEPAATEAAPVQDAPAKRPRPRRRAKAEAPAEPEAAQQAEAE